MKAKKVLAMLMATAMIMGTSVTAFAAGETSTITITNGAGESFEYFQIIVPDVNEKTGWNFFSTDIADAYISNLEATDAQDAIQKMIEGTATGAQISAALEAVKGLGLDLLSATDNKADDADFTFTVNEAGVYFIQGLDTEHYAYSPMAAYVSFETTDEGVYNPEGLEDATIAAKGQPIDIEKTSDDEVVEIGRTVEYTIESIIPYFAPEIQNPVYQIVDELTGADYVLNEDTGLLDIKVYVGFDAKEITPDTEPTGTESVSTRAKDAQTDTFTVPLSEYLKDEDNNTNANKKIVLKYSAEVTDLEVNNKVIVGDGTNEYDEDTDDVQTATVTLTKTGEAGVTLSDAKFVMYNDNDSDDSNNHYATFKKGEDESYILTGWVSSYETDDPASDTDGDGFVDATVIETNSSGQAVIKGLDGELTYTFKEVEAPEGYSLAADKGDIVWSDDDTDGTIGIADTKLAELPSTGGIGTTIFTIGGCVIMVTAAGLYFATRKKEQN